MRAFIINSAMNVVGPCIRLVWKPINGGSGPYESMLHIGYHFLGSALSVHPACRRLSFASPRSGTTGAWECGRTLAWRAAAGRGGRATI